MLIHTLPAYKRLTRQAEALIAGTYLAGTNTRRVRRALGALFGGAVGKDTVSRAWHKVQTDWEAWQKRDLSRDDIVRLILDGTVVKVFPSASHFRRAVPNRLFSCARSLAVT